MLSHALQYTYSTVSSIRVLSHPIVSAQAFHLLSPLFCHTNASRRTEQSYGSRSYQSTLTSEYSSQVHYKFWSLGHSHSILKPESLSRSLKTLSRGSAEKRTRFCAYLQGAEFLRSPVRKVHLRCERLPDGSVQMNTVIDSRTVCREFLSWCYGVTYRRFVPFVC